MKIVVCLKQVPGSMDIKVDALTNRVIRAGIDSVINPFDVYALEEGLRIKERYGGTVSVISMGPLHCMSALREALSFGADKAALVSGAEFAGADTLATAYALSAAIAKAGGADIVVMGRQTIDGGTGQVGPQVAEFLGIPHITTVCKIESIDGNDSIIVEKLVDDGVLVLACSLPVLLTVVKDINKPRFPSLKDRIRAKKVEIPVWGPDDICFDKRYVGAAGSATAVEQYDVPDAVEKTRKIFSGVAEETVKDLLHELTAVRKIFS